MGGLDFAQYQRVGVRPLPAKARVGCFLTLFLLLRFIENILVLSFQVVISESAPFTFYDSMSC